MKRTVVVFSRAMRVSTAAGGIKTYTHNQDLHELLGQAKQVRLQFVGHRKSGTARVALKMFESARPGVSPAEDGLQVGATQTVTTLRPAPWDWTGPYHGRAEILVEVDDTGGASQQEFDFELVATLILSE